MFGLFRRNKQVCNRFVTCYFVCSKDDVNQFMDIHQIPAISNGRSFFLLESDAVDYIKARRDTQQVVLVLRVPENLIQFLPDNTTLCLCKSVVNMDQCYQKTIFV